MDNEEKNNVKNGNEEKNNVKKASWEEIVLKIYETDFPFFGADEKGNQDKHRPVLVFDLGIGDVKVYPITSQFGSKSEKVQSSYFKINEWEQTGLEKQSYVNTHEITSRSASENDSKEHNKKLNEYNKKLKEFKKNFLAEIKEKDDKGEQKKKPSGSLTKNDKLGFYTHVYKTLTGNQKEIVDKDKKHDWLKTLTPQKLKALKTKKQEEAKKAEEDKNEGWKTFRGSKNKKAEYELDKDDEAFIDYLLSQIKAKEEERKKQKAEAKRKQQEEETKRKQQKEETERKKQEEKEAERKRQEKEEAERKKQEEQEEEKSWMIVGGNKNKKNKGKNNRITNNKTAAELTPEEKELERQQQELYAEQQKQREEREQLEQASQPKFGQSIYEKQYE